MTSIIIILVSINVKWILVVGVLFGTSARANDKAILSRYEAFVNIVNEIALPARMVEGHRIGSGDGECVLHFDGNYIGQNTNHARIYKELLISPLKGDIARFNSARSRADRELFRVDNENCNLLEYRGIDQGFRAPKKVVESPFAVRYVDEDKRERTKLRISTAKHPIDLPTSLDGTTVVDLQTGAIEGAGAGTVVLTWGRQNLIDWNRRQWSVLQDAKVKGKFFVRVRAGVEMISIDQMTPGAIVPFQEGAMLTVHERTSSGIKQLASLSWQREKSQPLFRRTTGGEQIWGRVPDAFEVQIVDSLSRVGPLIKDEILLTFSREANAQLQAGLDQAAKEITRTVDLASRNRKLYGSIAMIDAASGEVIGVAGFPASDPPERLGRSYLASIEREEFLKRRVIGSVAKVPISLAIVTANPILVDLRMKAWDKESFSTVLGQPVETFTDHESVGKCPKDIVDFDCFIAWSFNRYAVTLQSLAAVPSSTQASFFAGTGKALGEDEFWITEEGLLRHVTTQPTGFLFAKQTAGRSLAMLPWVTQIRNLFDIETDRIAGQGQAEQGHLYTWQHAIKPTRKSEALANFSVVSPERENLQLNLSKDLRADYIQLILGAAESRWSTLKIAEVFARAVSLKAVQATFVVPPNRQDKALALLPEMNDSVSRAHRVLLDAMEKVPTKNGTGGFVAKEILQLKAAASKRELILKVYAKTGTPRVDAITEGVETAAIQRLADKRLLTWSKRDKRDGSGWALFYRDRPIDAKLIQSLPDDKSDAFGGARAQHDLMRFLSTVNRQSGLNQVWYCKIIGASIHCPHERIVTQKNDDGRNLAMVLITSKPDGTVCRSVAVAYSLSVRRKSDDATFINMVRNTLSERGSVAASLGLTNDTKCPT
jgi:hypothetical protein